MLLSLLTIRSRLSILSRTPSSSFRLGAPKPAKPIRLNLKPSAVYARNRRRQSQRAHLACFQQLSLKNRPFFRTNELNGVKSAASRAGVRARPSVPSQRIRNHSTIEAKMCFGISSMLRKGSDGPGAKLIRYRTRGHPIGRARRRVAHPAPKCRRVRLSTLNSELLTVHSRLSPVDCELLTAILRS